MVSQGGCRDSYRPRVYVYFSKFTDSCESLQSRADRGIAYAPCASSCKLRGASRPITSPSQVKFRRSGKPTPAMLRLFSPLASAKHPCIIHNLAERHIPCWPIHASYRIPPLSPPPPRASGLYTAFPVLLPATPANDQTPELFHFVGYIVASLLHPCVGKS